MTRATRFLIPVGFAFGLIGLLTTLFGHTAILSITQKVFLFLFLFVHMSDPFLQLLPVSDSPPSKTYENWKDIPLPIYNYFYLFNITNVEELLVSKVVPDVKEIGNQASLVFFH